MSKEMEGVIIILILVLGMGGAVWLTRWANWFSFGENQQKKEQRQKRTAQRAALKQNETTKELEE